MLPSRALIGMVHLAALPGSPSARLSISAIADRAAAEASLLAKLGYHGLIVENMHDAPYVNTHAPETVAAMTAAAIAVRQAAPNLILGIQVLSYGHKEALAVALASGAHFIRVENFVFAHVADEGLMPTACAGELLRYRKLIGATHIKVFADIKKKHASHALTADVSISDAAHAAAFFGADGLIVTGSFTGQPADLDDVRAVKPATRLPVWVGSGVSTRNVRDTLDAADAAIVGSSIKRAGRWSNPIDPVRAKALLAARRT